MATFTWRPNVGAQLSRSPRVVVTQYGDGYSQRTPQGINTNPEEWSLNWNGISKSVANAIDDFLSAAGGADNFDWTNLRGVAGKYVCSQWQVTIADIDKYNVRATFKQVFEA